MRIRYLSTLALIILFAFGIPATVFAQDGSGPDNPFQDDTYEGLPICPPGIYLSDPVDCLPVGPSQTLTDWAEKGLPFP